MANRPNRALARHEVDSMAVVGLQILRGDLSMGTNFLTAAQTAARESEDFAG